MATAYTALEQSLADTLDSSDLKTDRAQEGQALKALCKELAEQTKVISDDYANALDRDKAKEDNSKLEFRGQLQSSLSNFALQFGKLDDGIGRAAREWGVEADKATPTTDAVVPAVAVQKPAAPVIPSQAAQPTAIGPGQPGPFDDTPGQQGAQASPLSKNDFVGFVWIVNKDSGLYLGVDSGSKNPGNGAWVWPADDSDNEKWILGRVSGFDGVKLVNKFCERCIGVRDESLKPGTDVIS
jgi:hypothetical protein